MKVYHEVPADLPSPKEIDKFPLMTAAITDAGLRFSARKGYQPGPIVEAYLAGPNSPCRPANTRVHCGMPNLLSTVEFASNLWLNRIPADTPNFPYAYGDGEFQVRDYLDFLLLGGGRLGAVATEPFGDVMVQAHWADGSLLDSVVADTFGQAYSSLINIVMDRVDPVELARLSEAEKARQRQFISDVCKPGPVVFV